MSTKTQTQLEYLDEIAHEAWAGNYARVGGGANAFSFIKSS